MKRVEVTPELEKLLQQVKDEDVVLTRDGQAVALLSDFNDEEVCWYDRERDPQFLASLERARDQAREGRVLGHDDLKKRLGID